MNAQYLQATEPNMMDCSLNFSAYCQQINLHFVLKMFVKNENLMLLHLRKRTKGLLSIYGSLNSNGSQI